jgi:hypothetical protein
MSWVMTRSWFCSLVLLVFVVLAGCSGSKDKDTEAVQTRDASAPNQTAESIRDYGRRPLDKARAAQQMGDERVEAMDEAIKKQ